MNNCRNPRRVTRRSKKTSGAVGVVRLEVAGAGRTGATPRSAVVGRSRFASITVALNVADGAARPRQRQTHRHPGRKSWKGKGRR